MKDNKDDYMKFSVLVLTYNPVLSNVLFTLDSIVNQKFDDFEIVVADDGSKDNLFPQIEEYFKEKNFSNYQLVANKENGGTVKNLLSALKVARGKYVRDFGAGDCFFDENSIRDVYEFLEKSDKEGCFGLMCGFYRDEKGMIKRKEFCHPFDINAYRKAKDNRILKNLVLYSDHASGAATCYRKEYYEEYLKKIENCVTYEEDIFQVIAALEGRRLDFFDHYLVWYEVGDGVSTQKNSRFAQLLQQDVDRFYEMIFEKFPEHKLVKKRKQVAKFYKIRNLYLRTILRFFVNPDAIRYLFASFLQRISGAHKEKVYREGFLDQKEFIR